MLRTKFHPRIFARLSFCLSLVFFILFFSWPLCIKYFSPSSSIALLWAFSILGTAILAAIFGIAAFWKGNREVLSNTEMRLARGGLLISCVCMLCIAIVTFMPHRHPSPVPIICTTELKQAWLVLMLYYEDHNMFPEPSELEGLIESENPMDNYRRKRLERLEKECPGHHYVYWQPQMPLSDNREHIPLMADAEPYHNGKKFVVFLDGKVELLTSKELESLIPSDANNHLEPK